MTRQLNTHLSRKSPLRPPTPTPPALARGQGPTGRKILGSSTPLGRSHPDSDNSEAWSGSRRQKLLPVPWQNGACPVLQEDIRKVQHDRGQVCFRQVCGKWLQTCGLPGAAQRAQLPLTRWSMSVVQSSSRQQGPIRSHVLGAAPGLWPRRKALSQTLHKLLVGRAPPHPLTPWP
eukprot:CAMPEP_0179025556 /NCGR_PEP_ID=MMETSP0796-20121207/8048_1 /TAXON_ID=73915 /ORGANISM="Pyrodinium bahamense, Strain pbaha01" /LENGTH=174 /DNA_ID=CAMNT_0020721585 /DNA_START=195 /DNA_END=719 /DNA_ORIENTATION=-